MSNPLPITAHITKLKLITERTDVELENYGGFCKVHRTYTKDSRIQSIPMGVVLRII